MTAAAKPPVCALALCGQVLHLLWPPFCPPHWRALPHPLADRVRRDTASILAGATPPSLTAAAEWLTERDFEQRSLTQRITGEREE